MRSRILRSAVIAAVLMLGVVGCGGAPGANTDDPAGAVTAALAAAQSGGVTKLADYACAAQKDEIANMFGGGGLGSLTGLGVNADDIFNAMKMEFKDVKATEKSRTGDSAVVSLTGTMTITVDPAKMREIMKQMLAAQGQPVDDATLDIAMGAMASQLSQTQPLNSDVPVVKEGGKWLICG